MENHPVSGRSPSITEKAFSCPFCGAYTSQTWADYHGRWLSRDDPLPPQYDVDDVRKYVEKELDPATKNSLQKLLKTIERLAQRKPFVDKLTEEGKHPDFTLENLHSSKCYVCGDVAIWVHSEMVYPKASIGERPHPDLPSEIQVDFEEARAILDRSPRGAAALLRLCVQKLCRYLGEKGKNIDDDIASMVSKGLAFEIQQALDAVRVIGNEAVHPGTMNLKDDRATAADLLSIVNFIVDEMITKPAKLRAIYQALPPEKLKGIEQRNLKALGEAKPAPKA
jgi:hypothetical protein